MLKQRIITALVLLAILLPALFYPSPGPFALVSVALLGAAGWEWARLNGCAPPMALALGAALAAGAAVSVTGSIGFVGLIVPHLVRLAIGNDQRLLLPAATLAGGVLLTVADTAARTVVAPIQLPVGVLTALIGVPVFLFLLARHPR